MFDRIANLIDRVDARRQPLEPMPHYTTYYLDAYIRHLDDPPILREAHARAATWDNMALTVGPDEQLIGELCHEQRTAELVYFYYGRGTTINRSRLEVCQAAGIIPPEVEHKLALVHEHAYGDWPRELATKAEQLSQDSGAAWAQTWGGHLVLDFDLLLNLGWEGIAAWVQASADDHGDEPETAPFFQAMRLTIQAASNLMDRYAELCEAQISRCAQPGRRHELAEMALRCRYMARGPAQDFRDAIQQVWFLHTLSGADSVGRFDQYLGRYYAQDVQAGTLTREQALEMVLEFWLKVAQVGPIQNLTVGGQRSDGADATNEVTYLAFEATRLLKRPDPNLCLRLHPHSPDKLWREALRTIAVGAGTPALYNDTPAIAGLIHLGIPETAVRDYCPAGCSQTVIPGYAHFMNDAGVYNAAKVLELTLHDGYDPRLEVQVGPHTGKPAELNAYAKLEDALRAQLDYFCRMEAQVNNLNYRHFAQREGYALRSLFTHDCVERGQSIWHGGARYNGIQLEIPGLTNLADSLAAIRELVYENETVSLAELVHILDEDWTGHEALRAAAQATPKFGNGDPSVDDIRARFTDYVYKRLQAQPAEGGGNYIPGEVIFVYHEGGGRQTGATPDGRLAHAVLADSAGAAQGKDKSGPTALMRSVAKLPHAAGTTSIVLNVKFGRDMFASEEQLERLESLVQTYFQMGGIQLQINVVDQNTLLAAQRTPEQYADLVVRVGGFSEYFCALSRQLQDDIIARTVH